MESLRHLLLHLTDQFIVVLDELVQPGIEPADGVQPEGESKQLFTLIGVQPRIEFIESVQQIELAEHDVQRKPRAKLAAHLMQSSTQRSSKDCYRLQENLVYGSFLYVDDLVTAAAQRGGQWGSRLLQALERLARASGCARLVLDTGLANARAQRFYFREGLLTGALRFQKQFDTP